MDIKEYYSRRDVQKEFLRLAKNREVQAWFGLGIAGRRPEIVNFEGDIKDLVKQGMSSFHISEERWRDPTLLQSGLSKKELDDFRIGWDVVLDLDSKNLDFSKYTAEFLIEALKFHDIKNYSLKFSGNHGFHIGLPFEAFPNEVNGVNIKNHFPDGVKIISEYLKDMVKEFLTAKILDNYTIEDAAKSVNKTPQDILVAGKFDVYKLVDIDSILISSRHLFRCAYSVNEKSNLVSIPIKSIKDFDIEKAKMENVKVDLKFLDLDNVLRGEARKLILEAFDWNNKFNLIEIFDTPKIFEVPKEAIKTEFFPKCILKLMNGGLDDGKKRAVFILINFLLNVGWSNEAIESFLISWNKTNKEPLREGYLKSQISWYKRQTKKILPPNCANDNYYSSLGIKCENSVCLKCKNPVNYAVRINNINRNLKKKK